MLPVELPGIDKFKTSGNPLDEDENWKNFTLDGKKLTRETDTLDTFVDSSWYFLRFCSPKNKDYGYDLEDVKYWMPVEIYWWCRTCNITFIIFKIFYECAFS